MIPSSEQNTLPRPDATISASRSSDQLMQMLLDMVESRYIKTGLLHFIKSIGDFGYTRKSGDKMPRANVWRPYRFAVQDVIFADTVLRHSKELNCIEPDVFLTAEPRYRTKFDKPAGEPLAGHPLYLYEPLNN
jgi:hypothetical protein